ncbi:hypothetical protein CLCR_07459 [Cladophialophora carrionii]|uniref:Major facilitator superfamily (MFS) profile domain-containing protein n=1 Tax=Cladophialophora carrionii TaxID=86049 RepID=A0A1C1CMC3_9EURO|nr:hypothetical protein CLCR_07459 [Cladophialophora carrionii]
MQLQLTESRYHIGGLNNIPRYYSADSVSVLTVTYVPYIVAELPPSAFTRHELQLRVCRSFCTLALAGAFSRLLAAPIAGADGVGGMDGWRWIFCLEGTFPPIYTFAFASLVSDQDSSRLHEAHSPSSLYPTLRNRSGASRLGVLNAVKTGSSRTSQANYLNRPCST